MLLFNWLHRFKRDHAQDGVREFQEMQKALSVPVQGRVHPPAAGPLPEADTVEANRPQ